MFLKQEETLTVVICKEFHSHQCHNFIQFFSELNFPLLKLLLIISKDFYVQALMISQPILHFANNIVVPKMGVQG
jgi:hypothetical protein